MEWETESNLQFLRENSEKDSTWEQYLLFNADVTGELRKMRIKHNESFANRSKERISKLEEAEKNGILVMK